MSIIFQYFSKQIIEPISLTINKPNATYNDAKEAIIKNLSNRNMHYSSNQIVLIVRGTKIQNTTLPLQPNTTIKIDIIDKIEKQFINQNQSENEQKEENGEDTKQIKKPAVFVQKETTKFDYRANIKARKQVPKQLAENYICKRCKKPGHHVKECPENSNRYLDKRDAAGLPISMYVLAEENDPNARLVKRGNKTERVVLKSLKGERFVAPIQNKPMAEQFELEIPKHLQCSICHHILSGSVIMRCCGKEICDDCFRNVKSQEKCIHCGKELDMEKGIQPNIKTRELVQAYWRKINAENAKKLRGDKEEENDDENATNGNEMEMDQHENEMNVQNAFPNGMDEIFGFACESIPHQPIDDFFKIDIRNAIDSGEIVEKKRFVWSMYKVPCPKPFEGPLLFSKRNMTVEQIFEEGKKKIEELQRKMEEENQQVEENENI